MTSFVSPGNTSYPYSAVVYVQVTFPDGQAFTGSGVMVGPNDVLTASHMLYSVADGGAASTVTISAGYNDGASPYGTYNAQQWYYYQINQDGDHLLTLSDTEYDVGIIALASRVGDATGWFGIDPNGYSGYYNLTGFPGVYSGYYGPRMTNDYGYATTDHNYFAFDYVSLESNPGNSGGPLWYDGSDGPYVVGVASTTTWAADVGGTYSQLLNWISEDDYLLPATSTITLATVQQEYQNIARTSIAIDAATQTVNDINAGNQTEDEFIDGVISSVKNTTGAALLLYDFIKGVTPDSPSLDGLTSTARSLVASAGGNGNASWQQMGASLADSKFNTAFINAYANLSIPALINALYEEIFGSTPSDFSKTYFSNLVSYYQGYFSHFADAGDPSGLTRAKGTLIGDMLKEAVDIGWGKYPAAALEFAHAAAHGNAVYGTDLVAQYGSGVQMVGTTNAFDINAVG